MRVMPVFLLPLVVLAAFALAMGPLQASPVVPGVPAAMPAAAEASLARELEWYEAEVPVTSQESRERDAALGRALAQVLVRVTGRTEAPADPVLQRALRVAESMALDIGYREVDEVAGGVPVRRPVLAARFDPEAVDALVMAAGLPLWRGERTKPLLWLAIDDGSGAGPRLVSAPQINVVRPLAQRGLERGLRLLLPEGSAVEQAAATRIWALDPSGLAVLAGRYGARVQLLGKLSRSGATGWTSEWLLADGTTEMARWSLTDPSPQRALAAGADRAADTLAQRQAIRVDGGRPEVLDAEIVGITSAEDWIAVAAYLQTLPVLRAFEVIEARPESVRLRLDLAVDRARFEALLAGGRRLAPDAAAAMDSPVRYRVTSP